VAPLAVSARVLPSQAAVGVLTIVSVGLLEIETVIIAEATQLSELVTLTV
jgi:hypothetical protein